MTPGREHLYEAVLTPCLKQPDYLNTQFTTRYLEAPDDEQRQYENYCKCSWRAIELFLNTPDRFDSALPTEEFEALFIFMATHHITWFLAEQPASPGRLTEKLNSLPLEYRQPGYMPRTIEEWLQKHRVPS